MDVRQSPRQVGVEEVLDVVPQQIRHRTMLPADAYRPHPGLAVSPNSRP
ncbi:hypothetical protein OH779_02945 [Actinacidiphila glaucinigra]|nr:hypothetical protein [Actinacidiphila glaucinigra]